MRAGSSTSVPVAAPASNHLQAIAACSVRLGLCPARQSSKGVVAGTDGKERIGWQRIFSSARSQREGRDILARERSSTPVFLSREQGVYALGDRVSERSQHLG